MICTQCKLHEAVVGDWCWRCDGWAAYDWPDATEAELEKTIIESARELGCRARKIHPRKGTKGIPDIRIQYGRNKALYVEVKKASGKGITLEQYEYARRLKTDGRILWGPEYVRAFVEDELPLLAEWEHELRGAL